MQFNERGLGNLYKQNQQQSYDLEQIQVQNDINSPPQSKHQQSQLCQIDYFQISSNSISNKSLNLQLIKLSTIQNLQELKNISQTTRYNKNRVFFEGEQVQKMMMGFIGMIQTLYDKQFEGKVKQKIVQEQINQKRKSIFLQLITTFKQLQNTSQIYMLYPDYQNLISTIFHQFIYKHASIPQCCSHFHTVSQQQHSLTIKGKKKYTLDLQKKCIEMDQQIVKQRSPLQNSEVMNIYENQKIQEKDILMQIRKIIQPHENIHLPLENQLLENKNKLLLQLETQYSNKLKDLQFKEEQLLKKKKKIQKIKQEKQKLDRETKMKFYSIQQNERSLQILNVPQYPLNPHQYK